MYAFLEHVLASDIMPIIHVWMTAFVGLITFGVAGLAATTFLPQKQLSMMAAPFAGISLWTLATLAIYVGSPGLTVSFDVAARVAWATLLLLSILLALINGIT